MAGGPILSAAETDYPPFSIVDADGRAEGFAVELLRAALAAMDREVTFRTGTWADVRGWLERGEIQALPLVGRTPEREAIFDFTFPYMSLHGAIVVRQDNQDIHGLGDLRGRRVAVMKGDNAEEFLRRGDRAMEIFTTPSFEDALRELAEGGYDAVVTQRLVALRLIQETGLTNLRVLDKPVEGFRQDFCFAVRDGDRTTLALLNEGLAIVMADGTYRHLHAKWFAALQLPLHRRIVVGGDHDYPPFEFLDENGHPSGFATELTRAIARELDLDIEFRLGPWSETIKRLENGEIDVVQGMFYTHQRDLKFDFTQPYAANHYVSVVRKGELPPPVTADDLKGLRIVIQRDDVVQDFLQEKGYGDQISFAETQEDALRQLAEGRHDCAVVVRITALHLRNEFGWNHLDLGRRPIFESEYAYAVRDGQKALLAQFSEGLKIVEANGEYRRLYEKWLGVYQEPDLSLLTAVRRLLLVLIPLGLILLGSFLWSWSLRRQVARQTMALRQSEEFQRAMIACSPVALYSINLQGKVLTWNSSAERIYQWPAVEVIGGDLPIIPEERRDDFAAMMQEVLEGDGFSGREVVRKRKDGSLVRVSLSIAPVRDSRGRVIGVMGAAEDITERKKAEEALRHSEELLRDMGRVARIGGWEFDPATGRGSWTEETARIHDLDPAGEASLEIGLGVYHEKSRARIVQALEEAASSARPFDLELELITARGSRKWVRTIGKPVLQDNRVVMVRGSMQDITDRVRLEAQLLQAQKMESVGRLAGGVAHDYNNMLSVIIGYAEMALDKVPAGTPLHEDLREILNAGKRSAEITRQLLAFARKQTVNPRVLDLNATVEGMLKMLRRLLGEDLDLTWQPAAGLWPVKIDPTQVDQILANLCVNARDAIKGVGKVTLETGNVTFDENYCADHAGFTPGDFVLLAVSDNGRGMDSETLDMIFEPFFTTKEPGRGTGLGLATVYGIVKQNNGFINAYSEPGAGTTFKIYLPRHADGIAERKKDRAPAPGMGRGETILLVEDEPTILQMSRTMLERLGYRVLAANTAAAAMALAEENAGSIDLLITDVVMPEMNGRELAGRLEAFCPNLRVLFMSGYTANVIARHGVLDKGLFFIQKPFSREQLAANVRLVLDR